MTRTDASATSSPACLGDSITFEITGVQDNSGLMQVECFAKQEVGPVEPTFVWRITKPDGSRSFGTGSTAVVAADQVGTYRCRFTARANRECEPNRLFVSQTVAVSPVTCDAQLSDGDVQILNVPGYQNLTEWQPVP